MASIARGAGGRTMGLSARAEGSAEPGRVSAERGVEERRGAAGGAGAGRAGGERDKGAAGDDGGRRRPPERKL